MRVFCGGELWCDLVVIIFILGVNLYGVCVAF